jgi:hypothetical protein
MSSSSDFWKSTRPEHRSVSEAPGQTLLQCIGRQLCRCSDACMTTPSTRVDGRRQKSGKARNRGRRIADGAAGYGELASRGMVTMVDFGWSNWLGRAAAG